MEVVEKNYRDVLVDLFLSKIEKHDSKYYEVERFTECSIPNINGVSCESYSILYTDIDKVYTFRFYIREPSGYKMVYAKYPTVKQCFLSAIDEFNKILLCHHCDRYVDTDNFYKDVEKCSSCILTDIVMESRDKSEYCSICMEHTKNYYTTSCGHKFHRACISKLKVKKCPLCREDL